MSLAPLNESFVDLNNPRLRTVSNELISRYSDISKNRILVIAPPASGKSYYVKRNPGCVDLDDIIEVIFDKYNWNKLEMGVVIDQNEDLFHSEMRFRVGAALALSDVFVTNLHDIATLYAYYFQFIVITVYVDDQTFERNLTLRDLDDETKAKFREWRSEYPEFMFQKSNIVLNSFDEIDAYRTSKTQKFFGKSDYDVDGRKNTTASGSTVRIAVLKQFSKFQGSTLVVGSESETVFNILEDSEINGSFVLTNIKQQDPQGPDADDVLTFAYVPKIASLIPYGSEISSIYIRPRVFPSDYSCYVGVPTSESDYSQYEYVMLIVNVLESYNFYASDMKFYSTADTPDVFIGIQIRDPAYKSRVKYVSDNLVTEPLTRRVIVNTFITVVPITNFASSKASNVIALFSLSNSNNTPPTQMISKLSRRRGYFIINYPSYEISSYMSLRNKNTMVQTINGVTYNDHVIYNANYSDDKYIVLPTSRLLMHCGYQSKGVYVYNSAGCFANRDLNLWICVTNIVPKPNIQEVITNMTAYVKCTTMTIRMHIGVTALEFHYFRRLAVCAAGGIPIMHYRISGYFIKPNTVLKIKARDPVAPAGHLINMLLSTEFHCVDFAVWMNVIEDNARMNQYGRPNLPKSYLAYSVDEIGNGLRFHSYADYIIAIAAYKLMAVHMNININEPVIAKIMDRLNNISIKYPTFNSPGYQARDFLSSIDSLEAARLSLTNSGD